MNVAVLASGGGTNLRVLLETVHGKEVEIVAVATDKPDAPALDHARAAGVETGVFETAAYPDRAARDAAMTAWLRERGVELVVLAGYMQLVSAEFLAAFPQRVINVHPSLLPAFPGIDALGQAIRYGARLTGVTVHFVDEGVDTGPIIFQRALEIGDTLEVLPLLERLRPLEYELLPEAVRRIAAGDVSFDPANERRVVVR
jgi:phosphoribosylglycinamide formyltransferase 1